MRALASVGALLSALAASWSKSGSQTALQQTRSVPLDQADFDVDLASLEWDYQYSWILDNLDTFDGSVDGRYVPNKGLLCFSESDSLTDPDGDEFFFGQMCPESGNAFVLCEADTGYPGYACITIHLLIDHLAKINRQREQQQELEVTEAAEARSGRQRGNQRDISNRDTTLFIRLVSSITSALIVLLVIGYCVPECIRRRRKKSEEIDPFNARIQATLASLQTIDDEVPAGPPNNTKVVEQQLPDASDLALNTSVSLYASQTGASVTQDANLVSASQMENSALDFVNQSALGKNSASRNQSQNITAADGTLSLSHKDCIQVQEEAASRQDQSGDLHQAQSPQLSSQELPVVAQKADD